MCLKEKMKSLISARTPTVLCVHTMIVLRMAYFQGRQKTMQNISEL